jgi:hypothetical protein
MPDQPDTSPEPRRTGAAAFRDDFAALLELVRGIDQGQNAGLEATGMLREEIASLHGLVAHLIQILTPEQPQEEGPSLRQLLQGLTQHQRDNTRLLNEIVAATGRIETRLGTVNPPAPAQPPQ